MSNLLTALAIVLIALLAIADASHAGVDLAAPAGNVRFLGEHGDDAAGGDIADAGDVNGDGRRDSIIAAPGVEPIPGRTSGAAYVVFGRREPRPLDLRNLGSGGFRIEGGRCISLLAPPSCHAGSEFPGAFEVTGAGDINADGLADIALIPPYSQAVYVVFGKKDSNPVDLEQLGSRGYRISYPQPGSPPFLMGSLAGGGDVDGDGRDDVAFGIESAGDEEAGTAVVVFGKSDTSPITPDGNGFEVTGGASGVNAGFSLAISPDMNDDHLAELIVGAPGLGMFRQGISGGMGVAYVVFGKSDTGSVSLRCCRRQIHGAEGFRIGGVHLGDTAGFSVATVGDMNGDRRPEVVIGAPGADDGGSGSGAAYLVYGKRDEAPVSLKRPGSRGFLMRPHRGDRGGFVVAGAGDVNGDRRNDILVGAPEADPRGRPSAGAAYVVLGRRRSTPVDLDHLRKRGFRIAGAAGLDAAGFSVARAGDVNRDGRGEVLVGVPRLDRDGEPDAGAVHLVFGRRR